MRAPLRALRTPRGQSAIVQSFGAPVGGWNARDALASMRASDAITLNNWYPRPSYCENRGGYSTYATGMTGNGKTLATYNPATGSNKLFCFTGSGIYDVSSAGAVGASKLSRTDGKHQYVNFGDGTNNWLIACNGVDKPAYFDGTTWTAVDSGTSPALSGVTSTQLVSVNAHQGRLFFLQNNSLAFWYLPAGAAGGALLSFDLSSVCKRGGYLVSMASLTRDSGAGQDDLAAFITSEGEVLVYQGNNPSSASFWQLVGVFYLAKPLGRRPVIQFGGDAIVLTQTGAFPLSKALLSSTINYQSALSDKILNAFTEAARNYGSIFGWEAMVYPAQSALLVNVPHAEDGTHEQFVMNTLTQAWCRFTGWDAETFGLLNGQLYFTKGTATYKAWDGTSDSGSNIVLYAKQAFQQFGDPRNKHVTLYMPMLVANGSLAYSGDIDVDFHDDSTMQTAAVSSTTVSQWDTAKWDVGQWNAANEMIRQWASPAEWQGRWISNKLQIVSNNLAVQWSGNTLVYQPASGL